MKSLIDSLGQYEIQTVVAQLHAELGGAPYALEGELADIIARMPLALFIKDAESRIMLMNPACETSWGVPFTELRGKVGDHHFPPEQMAGFLARDRAAFASRHYTVNEELLWHAVLRENRHLQTYKQPTYDAQGRPRLLIAVCVDITDRKRQEDALAATLQQLRALSDHEHTHKERERRNIALDLHDDLAQNLLALKLDLSTLHARTGARQPLLHRRSAQALATLDASIARVRKLINELHPSTLELGLSAAIEWQLQQIERRHGVHCRLHLAQGSADDLPDQRHRSAIFLIVQAALAHLSGHAGVRALQVTLNLTRERLAITISGDGEPGTEAPAAFDLSAIRERLTAFDGELAVVQLPGAGTVLNLSLPGIASPT